jgi:cytochrome P450 family 710 subfamily A protein
LFVVCVFSRSLSFLSFVERKHFLFFVLFFVLQSFFANKQIKVQEKHISIMWTPLLVALLRVAEWNIFSWIGIVVLGIVGAMIYEQVQFHIKKGSLPGPSYVVPFLGGILHMIRHPYDFWHSQMAMGPISWNSIIGQYFVMVTEADTVRKVFENVSSTMPLILHPNAETLLGKDNIAFLNGPEHKNLKASLLPLFTLRALTTYLDIQQKHIRESLQSWVELSKVSGKPLEMRPLIYDLNTNTSLSVFVGPYLTAEKRKQFQADYTTLTTGILAFPINAPGTLVNKARKATDNILENLTVVAAQSKERMRSQTQPECLLDYWMKNLVKEIDEAVANNEPAPAHSSDLDVAKVVLDFLFASQDASTSSLTFAVHLLSTYPDVLEKIRAEQQALRPNPDTPISYEMLSEMKYTWQVMRELLRFRPPATIVPHIAKKPFELSAEYTAPAGTLIVPSIWSSNRVGYSNPNAFDPERFSPERAEHLKYDRNFLTFGVGPHMCLGQRYAMNHIMLFISLFSSLCDFKRQITPNMEEIIYLPTIYPADGCMLENLTLRAL